MLDSIVKFLNSTGIAKLIESDGWWQNLIMIAVAGILVYLAIVKKFEPLLLLPIAIGMLLTNLPGSTLFHLGFFIQEEINYGQILHDGGFLDLLYLGVKLGIYPSLIFIGIGAMTDFSPLISNPKSLIIGAGAQLGVFVAFSFALLSGFFSPEEAASIGIIGGINARPNTIIPGASCSISNILTGILAWIALNKSISTTGNPNRNARFKGSRMISVKFLLAKAIILILSSPLSQHR